MLYHMHRIWKPIIENLAPVQVPFGMHFTEPEAVCYFSHAITHKRKLLTGSKSFIGYIQRDISTSNNKYTEK